MKIKLTEKQFNKLILKEDYYNCGGEWNPVCGRNTQNSDTIIYQNECFAETSAAEVLYVFDDSQKNIVKEGDFCSADLNIEKSVAIDHFIENVIEELREFQTKMTKGKEELCDFLENVCYGIEGGGEKVEKQLTPKIDCAMTEGDINSGSVIRKGCYNDLVGEIQTMLVGLGKDIGDFGPKKDGVDSKYGKYTMNGIREFQKENGLKEDGITEKNTYSKLKEVFDNKKNIKD